MTIQLPSGLTVQQVLDGLVEIEQLGFSLIGIPEAEALAAIVTRFAANAILQNALDAKAVLEGEIASEQASVDLLEAKEATEP
jgi:hypothetical protein